MQQPRKGPFDLGLKGPVVVALTGLILGLPAAAHPPTRALPQVVNASSRTEDAKLVMSGPASPTDLVASHTSHSSHSSHSSHASHSSHYSGSGTRSTPYTPSGYPSSDPSTSVESGAPSYPKAYSTWRYRPAPKAIPTPGGTSPVPTQAGVFQVDSMPGVLDKNFEQLEFDSYVHDYLCAMDSAGIKHRYYLPERLLNRLGSNHWPRGCSMGVVSYSTGNQENSISALIPQVLDKVHPLALGGRQFSGLLGWKLQRLDQERWVFQSPLEPAYISLTLVDYSEGARYGISINGSDPAGTEITRAGSEDKIWQFKAPGGAATLYVFKPAPGQSKAVAVFLNCPLSQYDFYLPAFEFWLTEQLTPNP